MKRASLPRRLARPLVWVAGLNAVVFLAYTLPRTLQERNLEARADALRVDLSTERGLAEQRRERARTLRANAADTERFLRQVLEPRQSGLVGALSEMERAAQEAGLLLRTRSYSRDEFREDPVVRLGVTLPVQGSYRALVGFLGRLEESERFLVVEQVQLQQRRQGSGDGELNVVVSAYFRLNEPGGSRGR